MSSSNQNRAVVPAQQQKPAKPYVDSADIVIIGNGIAGLTAAVEARHHDPEKRIVIITDQIHPTINTPSLKQFAIAKLTREQLLAYPAGTERSERIHLVTARVEEIHAQSKYVTLSGKRGFGYKSLLIATGSSPMGLPASTPGRDFDGVLTLHRLQDYVDFRRRLGEVSEAVVIGGGVHAIETVVGLIHWGIQVHWLIRGETFMGRMLDQPASEIVLDHMRRQGVKVHTKTEVAGVIGRIGSVAGVITNHQEMIPCQMVLTCTGTQPVMTLAERCTLPLRHKKGIVVDDQQRTSVPDIFAAGDIAALKNPQTGNYEPRPVWYAAVLQGRIAGAMITGHDELARQPFGVQWHATHLGDLSMLTVGDPMLEGNRIETLTDNSGGGYRRIAIEAGQLVGYLSLGGAQPDSLAIKRIIDDGLPVRVIIKQLLKGEVDARQYLSEQRSRFAQGILTGQLPPLDMPQPRSVPMNNQLTPMPSTELPASMLLSATSIPAMPPKSPNPDRRQPAAQQADSRQPATRARANEQPAPYEEISSFTGALPQLQQPVGRGNNQPPEPVRSTEEIRSLGPKPPLVVSRKRTDALGPLDGRAPTPKRNERSPSFLTGQPGDADPFTESGPLTEEISSFSGNLPVLTGGSEAKQFGIRKKAAEVAPVPAPANNTELDNKMRGLWAYVDEAPTNNITPNRQGQPAARDEKREEEIPERRPSRSLWSYKSQEKPVRIEKRR